MSRACVIIILRIVLSQSAQKQLTTTLFENIALSSNAKLLDEPLDVAARRESLRKQVQNLAAARTALTCIR